MSKELLSRQPEESFADFHIRLFENKDEYGIDNHKIAELLNKEFGSNYDESKWRKDYAQYKRWKDYILNKNLDEEILKKYEEMKIEAEKEKIRKQDQKREYRKLIRNQARFEKIRDDIVDAVKEISKKKPLVVEDNIVKIKGNKEGLVLFSDWHYGMICDNTFNKFNKQVFDERVKKLVEKTIEYGKKNEIDTLHVANLGDAISGQIHVSTRVQSNEDIVQQLKYVSETIAEVLAIFSKHFNKVKYYNVIGNHARTLPSKNEVGIKENFEYLIVWYLEARLKEIQNLEMVADEDAMILANICGEKVVFVHGNFDKLTKSVRDLPQMLGYIPDFIISGHLHHHNEKDYGTTTTIVNGSLVGVDDHAVQGRYFAKPYQKFILFDKEEGFEGSFKIKL